MADAKAKTITVYNKGNRTYRLKGMDGKPVELASGKGIELLEADAKALLEHHHDLIDVSNLVKSVDTQALLNEKEALLKKVAELTETVKDLSEQVAELKKKK